MAKKITKTSKKYDLKRSDIVEKLNEVIDSLDDVDVDSTSPNDMRTLVSDLVSELSDLVNGVQQEVY